MTFWRPDAILPMPDAGPSQLSTLEQCGLLSGRLAHLIANHLAVINGNLHAAAHFEDPDKSRAALEAALMAGNEASASLAKFLELRRVASVGGSLPVTELAMRLSKWVQTRPNWSVAEDLVAGDS